MINAIAMPDGSFAQIDFVNIGNNSKNTMNS
jgi:hypothetical protein